ncbi:MAG: D-glycero-beta-D-manno-heptose 1-phosphate adenylyltransferase [Flavobacteriales bacterium]|nr:D-glycero-beta-D-manno-heptose 1-phosphate adenylyltransferase [Flavobacteriales bacterium]PCH87178.1 MAG: D-glycero-beta-D-manno-heptose 1-phosphate adenylyltransferase [Flavobacteriales bacterium]
MSSLNQIKSKIKSLEELQKAVKGWKDAGNKIVFTNGCFDIVHLGHIDYLSKTADLGDVLVIGVNTDASVRRNKGESRPLQDEMGRTMLLASFLFVQAVVLFDEDTPYDLIKAVQPDVLVKGSDWSEEDIVGADTVRSNNGKVVTIEFLEGYSSTSIIEKAKNTA